MDTGVQSSLKKERLISTAHSPKRRSRRDSMDFTVDSCLRESFKLFGSYRLGMLEDHSTVDSNSSP